MKEARRVRKVAPGTPEETGAAGDGRAAEEKAPGVSGAPVDIVHLTFRPPFASGSYNRMVGAQIRNLPEFRQVAISYWEGPRPEGEDADTPVILVNGRGLSLRQKAYLCLPPRIRRYGRYGIGERKSLIYTWQVSSLLPSLKPKLIICYSKHWLAWELRRAVDWPCRIIFSQHCLSHYLESPEALQLYSLRSVDAVWTLTLASYRFERSRISAYEPSVTVLPNWVDDRRFTPAGEEEKKELRARWGIPEESLVVLLLSRLVPKKGAHVILQSWPAILEQVPNAYLWIVGGGDAGYERYLRRLAEALGATGSVRMEGRVSPAAAPSCYQASDVYLFPTLFVEGQSLSLLEAMACGLPCIVADHEVAREHYSGGEVVLVRDPNIEDAFAGPVVSLLRDEAERRRLGALARAAVEERFSERVMFARLKECYRRELSLATHGVSGESLRG